VIGHQQDWQSLAEMVNGMRERERPGARPVPDSDIPSLIDHIPPRVTSRFIVGKRPDGSRLESIYVETFIRPDDLIGRFNRATLDKVGRAIAAAGREGARIATLGGFTSILVEAGAEIPDDAPVLTSGNSLTAALIIHGVERALRLLGRKMEDEIVTVIGATGDIGSGVSRWLAGRCRSLILVARNPARLEAEAARLRSHGADVKHADIAGGLRDATLVISAASTAGAAFSTDPCHPGALLCDAGYPKNLEADLPPGARLFYGGMGSIAGGIRSHDGLLEKFYRFPRPNIAHGCILEGVVLALADRFEPFSTGRGKITTEKIDEIWNLATTHGVTPAPLFNAHGIWPEETDNGN